MSARVAAVLGLLLAGAMGLLAATQPWGSATLLDGRELAVAGQDVAGALTTLSLATVALALVLLDLDSFKDVNDTLGHGAGDVLLAEVAARLSNALRGRGVLARLGGDEFAVLLHDFGNAEQASALAAELQDSLEAPFRIAGREFRVGCSAGVAMAGPSEAASLLANADFALCRAKTAGHRQCRVFDAAMREEHVARRTLEEEVRRAALGGEFELHYQPQVRLADGVLVGAEALLRWRHPVRGLLRPGVFLDALEAGSLAGAVGDWAIEEACRQAALWRGQGLNLRVGVNLFAEQVRAGNLEATVRAVLARWSLPPEALELELTEGTLMENQREVADDLHALRRLGVRVAIDDFGTGYSSLAYLQHLPIDRLKIDSSFVRGLDTDANGAAVVDAVVGIGRSLSMEVLAEGVETAGQLRRVRAAGCQSVQGYYFSRPVPAGAFDRWWARHRSPAAVV